MLVQQIFLVLAQFDSLTLALQSSRHSSLRKYPIRQASHVVVAKQASIAHSNTELGSQLALLQSLMDVSNRLATHRKMGTLESLTHLIIANGGLQVTSQKEFKIANLQLSCQLVIHLSHRCILESIVHHEHFNVCR